MKVSFLVTYYNQEQYVRQSLESILSIQKKSDWELLVGDDGSSDDTVRIVKEYMNLYPDNIRLYVMPRDKNEQSSSVSRASANRLNLMKNATGEFLCFLDGDDYYCDNTFLEEAIQVFQEDSEISVVAFGFKYVSLQQETIATAIPIERYIPEREYLKKYYVHVGACVLRNVSTEERWEYLCRVGFFDDNDIFINNLNYGKLYSINRVIYAYRQSDNSLWNSMDKVEQAVLNVQGYDVDKKYIDRCQDVLLERSKDSICLMYFLRGKLKKALGNDKYEKYVRSCQLIGDSLAEKLLRYQYLEDNERRSIRKMIRKIAVKFPKMWFRCWLRSVKIRILM